MIVASNAITETLLRALVPTMAASVLLASA